MDHLNLGLPKDLSDRLNKYCVKRINKNGKIKQGLRQNIGRAALTEWLKNHENDVNVEL